MPANSGTIHQIQWKELCPWLIQVAALRASFFVPVLLSAWIGVLLTQWGWSSLAGVLPVSTAQLGELVVAPVEQRVSLPPEVWEPTSRPIFQESEVGPIVRAWYWLSLPFLLAMAPARSWSEVLCLLPFGFWGIAVWAFFGGVIARISAVYLCRTEPLSLHSALHSGFKNWPATMGAPCLGIALGSLVLFPLAIIGLLMQLANLLTLLAGLVWILWLTWGAVLAVVLIALWLGWPFAWATTAVEHTDAFDAVSRSAAYVYQRPLYLAFYVLVASLLGLAGQWVVDALVIAIAYATEWAISWGASGELIESLLSFDNAEIEPDALAGSTVLGAQAIHFWKGVLSSLAGSYPMAYFFSATVAIYLLMRSQVDGTELDELTFDKEETIDHSVNSPSRQTTE